MRILHISDLHFGKHNSDLAESVKDRAKAIQPDLILATGDLADQPTNKLLIDAKKFLEELKKSCADRPQSDPGRPQLIVIPGNHDVRYWGNLRISDDNYRNTFAGVPVHYYFQLENVWVYGFDSSLEIRTGANGRVAAADLTRFNRLYDDLKEQHKEKFESAFKIVAIHHHPVPIKYDDSVAKWLVLTNAGEFLGEILKRKIDLVLHGHEHIRARARYGRQLRVEGPQEVPIISVGSTLKKNAGERNCFHVIEISNLGTIRVDYYGADLNQFDHAPSEPYEIISAEQAQERTFEGVRKEAGFCYSGLASITKINKDGDALRIVECHDLRVADPSKARASLHIASTSSTSGYVDMPRASAIRGNGLLKLQLTGFQVKTAKAITGEPVEWADFTIDYGRKLARNEVISYSYSWYAVNSFAMNERETRLKYSEPTPLEFTHFTVNDPIEDLAIIVQFPEDFVLPTEGPQPRVIKVDPEGPEPGIEAGLRASNALQYYESLRTASLRVRRPAIGYSYGIQWAVPASPPAPRGPVAGRLDEIINGLLSLRTKPTESGQVFSKRFLFTVGDGLRKGLIPGSAEPLELSLMVFDPERKEMVLVNKTLVATSLEDSEWKTPTSAGFRYGEGVGGKVFKTNQPRLYVALTAEEHKERKTPDFYRDLAGQTKHAVLLSLPIQNPEEDDHVYGVLNCGSSSRSCRLWEIGRRGGPVTANNFASLQSWLNDICFQLFKQRFLT